jgi:predicted DNA-binding transcriptional regulator AlpA
MPSPTPKRLYGTGELQRRLGVSRERIRQIVRREDFPEPFDRLSMGTVWLIEDVEAWIREHRPDDARDASDEA